MTIPTDHQALLVRLLCGITDPDMVQAVLEAVLTPKELREIDQRIRIFQMLSAQIPQRDIAERLNVGVATVTRGAQAYRNERLFTIAPEILDRIHP